MTVYTDKEIIQLAMNVTTYEDAEKLLQALKPHADDWNHVGDIATNQGAINIYENPAHALIERITNAMDAILELMRINNPSIIAHSPHEFVSKIWGIESVSELPINNPKLKELKKLINIELTDSGERKKPTVIVSDSGIGIHPSEARDTILSLHGNNKKGKFYLHGMFGQGGSGTFASCEISVIITRKASITLDGKEDLVGITVVKKTHDDDEQLPSYKYLCDNDKNIPGFDPSGVVDFDKGVKVIHVGYDIGNTHKRPVYDKNGLSGFLGQRMFDPALPVTFIGSRTNPNDLNEGNPTVRTARGLSYRLGIKNRGKSRAVYDDKISISLDRGRGFVEVRLWLIHWPDHIQKTAKSARGSFIPVDKHPIVFTNSGQTIDSLPSSWFRKKTGLGLIAEGIVMDIAIDKLDHKEKASLVGGNRKLVQTGLYDEIMEHIIDRLLADDNLKRWEEKFANRRATREIVDEELTKRLGEKIDTYLNRATGSIEITGTAGEKVGGTVDKEEPKKKNLPVIPTRIICNPPDILLRQGLSTSFTIDIDAQEGLLEQEGNSLELIWEGNETGISTSTGVLKNGEIRTHIKAGKGVVTGKRKLTVQLKLAEKTLENTIPVEIKEPTKSSKRRQVKKVKAPPTGPIIVRVNKDQWPEHDWDEDDVGKVEFGVDKTTIFLNFDAKHCRDYISAPGKAEQWVSRMENDWVLKAGFAVFRLDHHNEKVANGNAMSDEQLRTTKTIYAETIVVGREATN